jgi:hypothetical protein
MEKVIKKIVEELNASSGAIMVRSPKDDNLLVCGASYNMPKVWDNLVNTVEDNPKNLNGTVAFTGKPITANKVNKIFHGYPVNSVIVVPVLRSGKVVANIEVISDTDKRFFSDEDLKYLQKEAEKLADKIV